MRSGFSDTESMYNIPCGDDESHIALKSSILDVVIRYNLSQGTDDDQCPPVLFCINISSCHSKWSGHRNFQILYLS